MSRREISGFAAKITFVARKATHPRRSMDGQAPAEPWTLPLVLPSASKQAWFRQTALHRASSLSSHAKFECTRTHALAVLAVALVVASAVETMEPSQTQ